MELGLGEIEKYEYTTKPMTKRVAEMYDCAQVMETMRTDPVAVHYRISVFRPPHASEVFIDTEGRIGSTDHDFDDHIPLLILERKPAPPRRLIFEEYSQEEAIANGEHCLAATADGTIFHTIEPYVLELGEFFIKRVSY